MLERIIALIRNRREVKMALASGLRIASGVGGTEVLGGLTDEEMSGLISWLPERGIFVEFGTLFGFTAKSVAAARPNLKIIAIDNFSWNPFGLKSPLHEAFTRRILSNEIASGQVEVHNTTSAEFRASLTANSQLLTANSIDAVFFDALHQYEPVKEELEWAKGMGIKVIAGHDYKNPSPVFGVTRAVDECFPGGVKTAGMCWCAK